MKSGRLVVCVLLGMLFSVVGVDVCLASSYYVSSVYGDDSYAGTTYLTAFETIEHALSVCSSSDNIYLVTGSEFCEAFSDSNNRQQKP